MTAKKITLFSLVAFFIISFLMRLLLPFGSEPDFLYRINMVLNGNTVFRAFLKFFYEDFSWHPTCSYTYSMTGFTGNIDGFLCGESLYQKLMRWLLQLFYVCIISLLLWTRFLLNKSKVYQVQDIKLNAILISLIFPSMIYFTGVAAEEQITLFLSILIIIVLKSPVLLLLLIYSIFTVEIGSAMVVTVFVITYYGFDFLSKKSSFKTVEFVAIICILICAVFKMQLLTILFNLPIVGEKIRIIHDAYTFSSYAVVVDKYPIILRPIMTFMSGVFMTPHGIKSIILYPIVLYFSFDLFKKLRKNAVNVKDKNDYVLFVTIITFIICTVFVLPGYSNAKYYIFTLPLLSYLAIKIYDEKKVFLFYLLSSLLVLFQLLVARV